MQHEGRHSSGGLLRIYLLTYDWYDLTHLDLVIEFRL